MNDQMPSPPIVRSCATAVPVLPTGTACELMVGANAVSARARVAEGEERTRIWAQMAKIYPPYLDYEKATTRKIPVVVLDPT